MQKNPKLLIALALIPQIILINILAQFPEFVETYYSNCLYQWISALSRYVFGWMPFSFGDVFYAAAIIFIIRWLVITRKRIFKDFKNWIIDIFATISLIYFAFHLFWAFNYYRLPLHKNLNLKADYSTEELITVTEKLINKSNALHLKVATHDTVIVDLPYSKKDILSMAPLGYVQLQKQYPHLEYHPKSIKMSLFSVPLTYMGFSGYLNPLTNEAQVDELIPIYKFPTTVSHEIAHQLGYAAENEANFIGSLAAMSHTDQHFKYSGTTFALRHCLMEVFRRNPEKYQELLLTINIGILKNYQEVQDFWRRYQNITEPVFKETYNSFLKANNQQGGMESYSYVVALYVNYFLEN
ncbi:MULTISPECIES: DUF3810 domain-containing protein [Bizionia]|uniref:DUF3810 domain-containing protein n=1 Tax=Bizionia algoritergicola TaxID=291187 RepID=A0A5D0QU22_9FLAO|nr:MULTISPECIES: DUF3810 domain-containing protein [Bizionia]OBX17636.1 amino acid permease [Bizionia sp. APA-3]TYB71684.1 DUF3810 domain-containing protein [Bizionia algoritergicola]